MLARWREARRAARPQGFVGPLHDDLANSCRKSVQGIIAEVCIAFRRL